MSTGSAPGSEHRHGDRLVQHTDISTGTGVAVTGSRVIVGGQVGELNGFAFTEPTDVTPTVVRLRDGKDANARIFARINLGINESAREWWTKPGLECYSGIIFLEVITGSIEGVVFWRQAEKPARG